MGQKTKKARANAVNWQGALPSTPGKPPALLVVIFESGMHKLVYLDPYNHNLSILYCACFDCYYPARTTTYGYHTIQPPYASLTHVLRLHKATNLSVHELLSMLRVLCISKGLYCTI